MHSLQTKIEINAPAHLIWEVLIDTINYDRWNPLIHEIEGEFYQDAEIRVRLCPDEESILERVRTKLDKRNQLKGSPFEEDINSLNKKSSYVARVTTYKDSEVLEWGRSSFWLGTYNHRFSLIQVSTKKTLLENEIQMGGKLISMGWDKFIKHYYEAGLELMNVALKVKVEEGADFYIVE